MPTPRRSAAGAVLDGKLYVAAGLNGANTPTTILEVYDPVSNGWSAGPQVQTARFGAGAAAMNGKLYVIGGHTGRSHLNAISVYDPANNTWQPKSSMPVGLAGVKAVVINDRIYVEGEEFGGTFHFLIYSPATDRWTPRLTVPRNPPTNFGNASSAGALDGKFYAAGGQVSGQVNGLDILRVYDPAADNWTFKARMPAARAQGRGVSLGGQFFVFGGFQPGAAGGGDRASVFVYDPASDSWSSKTPMPSWRQDFAVGAIAGKIYLAGGSSSSGLIAETAIYTPDSGLSPPSITAQPQSQTVCLGRSATFQVTATGTPPLSYQWRKAGANITGANSPTLSLNNVQADSGGQYSVVVSNTAGSMTSKPVPLDVNLPPVITQQPQRKAVSAGGSAQFEVKASGADPLSYQWFKNDKAVAGATDRALVLPNVQAADVGDYNVELGNTCGKLRSEKATLSILGAISSLPRSYAPGTAVTVSITVTPGSDTVSYVVEDQPPAGWAVSNITESGLFDVKNRKVKWGPLFANTRRTLSYQTTPPASASGRVEFSGLVSFDGSSVVITGERTSTAIDRPHYSFSNSDRIVIQDNTVATPYPLRISVADVRGVVSSVSVTIHKLSHTYTRDLSMLLVGPKGERVVLMRKAGGKKAAGAVNDVTLTFSDSAPSAVPTERQLITGTYKPTDFAPGLPFPSPAPAGPYASSLAVLNGVDPNGVWALYVADAEVEDTGAIEGGWSLTISTGTSAVNILPTITPTQPGQVAVRGDFSGDGKPDLIFQSDAGLLAGWQMDNTAMITADYLIPKNVDVNWRIVSSGKFDGDAKEDLVFQHTDGTVAVWFMNGTSLVSASLLDPSNSGRKDWRVFGTGDMNKDGNPDLLFQHTDGTLAVWYLNGIKLNSGALFEPQSSGEWKAVGVSDWNGDGHQDLVLQHLDGTLGLWYLSGVRLTEATSFTPQKPVDVRWRIVSVIDRNGDGKPDLLFQNSDGPLGIWFMDRTKLSRAESLNPENPGRIWKAVAP